MLYIGRYIVIMEQCTKQHKGKLIEEAIKATDFQMKAVAEKLGITRNTLYTKLQAKELDDSFIIHISNIIHYDFSNIFPEIYAKAERKIKDNPQQLYENIDKPCNIADELPYYQNRYKHPYFVDLQALNEKYLKLMEDYYKLLKILTLLANNNELIGVKKEIMEFLENESKEEFSFPFDK